MNFFAFSQPLDGSHSSNKLSSFITSTSVLGVDNVETLVITHPTCWSALMTPLQLFDGDDTAAEEEVDGDDSEGVSLALMPVFGFFSKKLSRVTPLCFLPSLCHT